MDGGIIFVTGGVIGAIISIWELVNAESPLSRKQKMLMWGVVLICSFIGGLAFNSAHLGLKLIAAVVFGGYGGLMATFCAAVYIYQQSQKKPEPSAEQQHHKDDEFNTDYDPADETNFKYHSSAFKDNTPPPDPPRGFDQRKPADAKLWAIIDDPNANEGESLAALKAIHKRRT